MPVCKLVYQLVNKYKGSIILYASIFIGITVMMATMGGGNQVESYTSKKIKVAIFDEDKSELSTALVHYMKDKNKVVKIKKNEDSITDALFYREIQYAITIPKGFGESSEAGSEKKIETRKLPGSFTTSAMEMELNDYIQTYQSFCKLGYDSDEAIQKTLESVNTNLKVTLENDSRFGGNTAGFMFYFQYFAYVILAMGISAIGPVLMVFFKRELQKRNLCSSMRFGKMNLQLTLACVSIILGIYVLLMAVGIGMYSGEKNFYTVLPYLLLNSLDMTLITVGIVFIAGMVSKSDIMISGISNVVSLGLSFIGGVFVPMEVMSKQVLSFSRYLPTYWYMKTIEAIGNLGGKRESVYLGQMWTGIGIQFAFAIAFLAIGFLISKKKLMDA